jgi:hypothetical protein
MTRVLHGAGVLGHGRVVSVSVDAIGEGQGFVGRLFRCSIAYDREVPTAPKTLIAKFPTDHMGRRSLFDEFGLYEREVRFYRQLRDETPMPTPLCFFSERDPATGDFAILLEDVAPAAPGDPLVGCTVEEARAAVDLISRMHLKWWQDETLDRQEWLPAPNSEQMKHRVAETYQSAWGAFVDRIGEHLPDALLKLGPKLGEHLPTVLDRLSSPPRTLVHGDFQLGNIFYSEARDIVVVADWQVIVRARGPMDVAYFLARSLDPKDRRAAEGELIRRYHRNLRSNGVEGYTFQESWNDYRLAVLSQFGLGVVLGYALAGETAEETTQSRQEALAAVVSARLIAALRDLRPQEILESQSFWRRIPFVSRGR